MKLKYLICLLFLFKTTLVLCENFQRGQLTSTIDKAQANLCLQQANEKVECKRTDPFSKATCNYFKQTCLNNARRSLLTNNF